MMGRGSTDTIIHLQAVTRTMASGRNGGRGKMNNQEKLFIVKQANLMRALASAAKRVFGIHKTPSAPLSLPKPPPMPGRPKGLSQAPPKSQPSHQRPDHKPQSRPMWTLDPQGRRVDWRGEILE